jgi:diaminohydroxyphosphoribosylaminopyrimidine deaminase/5-amino-6-(5-phosphoribosylamino)uracil reductase
LADKCVALNEAFNHWIVHRTPFVTVKAAMTLDGKIATASGESKWITGEQARAHGMKLRQGSDAILVGVNTVLMDDPSLTLRTKGNIQHSTFNIRRSKLRRIVLDSMARTPLTARVISDKHAALTTIVVSNKAPKARVAALAERVQVLVCPSRITHHASRINPGWLLKKLGSENVTSLLVEGGGETNAAFLLGGFAQQLAFFYAPKILGGRDSRRAVAGEGAVSLAEVLRLTNVEWRRLGPDLLLVAKVCR